MAVTYRRSILLFAFLISPFWNPGFASDYRAAIFDEPNFPIEGCATPAQTFLDACAEQGIGAERLNADAISDATRFNGSRYDLLIVPTGASFPLSAKSALLQFLQQGGDLLCTGGYAFDNLCVRDNGAWISYKDYWVQQMGEARNPALHLTSNGSFEEGKSGWSTARPDLCKIVETTPYSGRYCAQIVNTASDGGARWEKTLPVKAGESYLIGAQVRTGDIQGSGYGYLAVYQYDAQGTLLKFIDFAQFWKSQDWKRSETLLTIEKQAAKVMFYGGLFQASGSLWMDDVTCAPLAKEERINAHYGNPQDGLIVDSTQLTLFSPDQWFEGATLKPAMENSGMADWASPGAVKGYEATSQLRYNARWIPWLAAYDQQGRPSGIAGAFVDHYSGALNRSRWAIFGVANRDVFSGSEGQTLLRETLKRLSNGIMLQSLTTDYALYQKGETAPIHLKVNNISMKPANVTCTLTLSPLGVEDISTNLYSVVQQIPFPAQSTQTLDFSWTVPESAPDFVVIKAEIKSENRLTDRIESGFCVADDTVVQKGIPIRYRDNAFELGSSRKVCLWGTDTYANMFSSPSQSPRTWLRDLQMMRDYGLHMYENLQYISWQNGYSQKQWRQMDAIVQLSQKFDLPYMAGLLIGQNVVVDNSELQKQVELCRTFAERYARVPGLIYYLNGDFQLLLKDTGDIRGLWNDFLRQRYASDEALKKAWPANTVEAPIGSIPVRDYAAQTVYDVKARDLNLFRVGLMKRWIGALCQAIRNQDGDHPITSEYYQRPYSGIDLRLTLGDMDAANFGYFDRPETDIARLMATIKWNDMRLYGKTVNIGEFGVKTHDAWAMERGGSHYHIQRTPEQQLELFWSVVHAALAMGVTKIQNWCWSDDSDSVFPWGIAWSNPARPKPAAKLYRNLRFLAEQMQPEYVPAEVVFMMPDNWRLGAPENLSHTSLLNALECLLAAGAPYDVIDENQLERLSAKPPRLLVAPLAYALEDETIQRLIALAEGGTRVYLSGDPSMNPLGQRIEERLEKLCGVQSSGVSAHPSGLAVPQVTPTKAEQIENPMNTPFFRTKVGSGEVYFSPTPWETLPGVDVFVEQPEITASAKTNLYLSLLPLAGIAAPASVASSSGVWRIMKTPGGDRQWLSLFPRSKSCVNATVEIESNAHRVRYEFQKAVPAGVLSDSQNRLLAATGSGNLFVDSKSAIQGNSPWTVVSLEKRSLADSQTLLVSATNGGRVWWSSAATGFIAMLIEWRDGQRIDVPEPSLQAKDGGWELETLPNDLYLIAPKDQMADKLKWLEEQYREGMSSCPNWERM